MYRGVLLYGRLPGLMDLGIVIFSGVVLLIMGSSLFRKLSSRFAEEI
jgi:lipopolysaccharide transport system permease protein